MKRSYRRHRNPQKEEKNEQPFFSSAHEQPHSAQPFFAATGIQKKELTIGKPGDKYEQEADAMADTVVSQSSGTPGIHKKEISGIQRETLATPAEDEKLGTAEQRMEEDKMVQEKPAQETPGEKEEKEIPVQEMHKDEKKTEMKKEEEEVPIQTKGEGSTTSPTLTQTIKRKAGGGKPLSGKTQAEMESAFGRDFSEVNIHTDEEAVKMNKNLHAQAFTHGKDIYFNAGKYNPDTGAGKHLLAHELTHVVQQNNGLHQKVQRVTCRNQSGQQPERRPQGEQNALDERARLIIGMASEENTSNAQKAVNILNAIICYYYNPLQGMVRNVTYDPDLSSGLITTRVGRGNDAKGDIAVSDQFIQGTTASHFARRVLQVGHELRHIQQYRSGLIGSANKNEREFLAFYENALADEFAGTGRMSRATRRSLIDAALGYYYCLSTEKQEEFQGHKTHLLSRRSAINDSAGSGPTSPPTTCSTQ